MAGILVVVGTITVVFIFWSLLKLDECETKAYLENFYRGAKPPKQGKSVWGNNKPFYVNKYKDNNQWK